MRARFDCRAVGRTDNLIARRESEMARLRHASAEQRRAYFEQYEQRLVMSAQTVAALLPELHLAAPAISQQILAQPLNTSSVSPTTAAANIATQYGFDGKGQTVAVIDSGIAWDHNAFGGGFGQGHKVVGGWDFADNDASPYDSGPAAMHGTHVAGIIGSTHSTYKGVSSGVDLVSLRVFNNQGQGNLEWVRQALHWVHQNRNSFQNPITTVVMSLGTTWNAHNTPGWAALETELGKLKQAGIFISVAAGNSFQDYHAPGLSYPAVSPHVVPVSSHGANGQMSEFSQRASRALMAPGENIRSAVPNHLFVNGMANRFMALTGTSMAAPYVGGVSTILRQANDFMGRTGITQDLLYQQLIDSADRIFDPVTNGVYSRVNLAAALNKIIPDLEGNSAATAKNIGTVRGAEQIRGTIGRMDDVDFFAFTAASSGQLRLTIQTTHQLNAVVNVIGSQATINGNEITFAVEAGRVYQFSVATNNGIGHYTLDTHLQAGPPAIQWGQIASKSFSPQNIRGESMFQMQASQDGLLMFQTSASQSAQLRLEVYNSQMNRIGTSSGDCADLRLCITAKKGETYFLKAVGNADLVRFNVGNTVSLSSGVLTINGTNGNDSFAVDARNGFSVSVNGISYQFQTSQVSNIRIDGRSGTDALSLRLGAQNDIVHTQTDRVSVVNSAFRIQATNVNHHFLDGGAGANSVLMNDSSGNDILTATFNQTTLSGTGFSSTIENFRTVRVVSSSGFDHAAITGTVNSDVFHVDQGRSRLFAGGRTWIVEGFNFTQLHGGGGQDHANISESIGDREIDIRYRYAGVHASQSFVGIHSVSTINVTAQSGNALLRFRDSFADDNFVVQNATATMRTLDLFNASASGFKKIEVQSHHGADTAQLFDTVANDTFLSTGNRTELRSSTRTVTTIGVNNVQVISQSGGFDTATFIGTSGIDNLAVNHNSVTMQDGNGRVRRIVGFHRTEVDLGLGNDSVRYQGSAQSESLRVQRAQTEFNTTQQNVIVKNARESTFIGGGGNDQAILEELNLLEGLGSRAVAYLENHRVTAENMSFLEARSVDQAMAEYDLEMVDFQYLLGGNWRTR
jgi:hypothetical protein